MIVRHNHGLGHAVYTASDPRAEIIKKYAVEMAAGTDKMEDLN